MLNRTLRITRIVVSLAIFIILTTALTAPALTLPYVAGWLENIQLVPVLLGYSFFTFVVWLIVTLVFGRIYCSSVCPLGTLQDISARATRLHSTRPYRHATSRNTLRYTFLVAMLICLMLQNAIAVAILDPYSTYASYCQRLLAPILGLGVGQSVVSALPATALAICTFAAVVVISARSGRTICNTICPVGTGLGLVSRFAVLHIDIDTDKCIQCRRCVDACKGSCIDLTDHTVDSSRCVVCFSCLPVCTNDAIHYTSSRKQLSIPMMQRIPDSIVPKKPEAALNSVNPDKTTDTK